MVTVYIATLKQQKKKTELGNVPRVHVLDICPGDHPDVSGKVYLEVNVAVWIFFLGRFPRVAGFGMDPYSSNFIYFFRVDVSTYGYIYKP